MKKLILMAMAIFFVSCSDYMLPDKYYDARLEGVWVQDNPAVGSYRTLTFNRAYGEFIGDIEGTGTVEGQWNANFDDVFGYDTLSLMFSQEEAYFYEYVFLSDDSFELIPSGTIVEGYTKGIGEGIYHR